MKGRAPRFLLLLLLLLRGVRRLRVLWTQQRARNVVVVRHCDESAHSRARAPLKKKLQMCAIVAPLVARGRPARRVAAAPLPARAAAGVGTRVKALRPRPTKRPSPPRLLRALETL